MKRRNADTGKLRRPIKRTKIIEGMYGNSMLYVKFVLLWSSIALADYMLEFRFEFLGPLWLMIKSIHNCYHSKGLAFTVFFTCVALTSDLVCYFIIPMQVLTFLAGVYVWVNYIWITFESKGMCTQTLCMWLVVVYVEALRTGFLTTLMSGALPEEPDEWGAKPWAAGALGFPFISLGVNAKQKLDDRLRLRTQRQVRAQNEFYFKLMREAIPEGGLPTSTYASDLLGELDNTQAEVNKNSAVKMKRLPKSETNGHCVKDKEYLSLKAKLEHLEQYVDKKTRARDSSTQSQKSTQSTQSQKSSQSQKCSHSAQSVCSTASSPHVPHTNGVAKGPGCDEAAKSTKYDKKEAASPKEDKRKKKHKELDKENVDSHKSTDNAKELIDKEVESTNENVKVRECNNIHKTEEKVRDEERKREREEEKKREEEKRKEKEEERRRERDEEKKREKERERELKEREKEREKEKERERELLSARECAAELTRVKAELEAAQRSEAACARQLAACLAGDQQRRAMQADLNAQLQHKMSTWRSNERAALERKLGEERRLRIAADQQLLKARRTSQSECESESCMSRRAAVSIELTTLRKDLQRTRDRLTHAQRDLTQANETVSALQSQQSLHSLNASNPNSCGVRELEARAEHLEQVLSAETRVKLDLLGALGDANRKMRIHESLIHRQEKELEKLKAQMLAVMPPDYVSPTPGATGRLSASPLDPNASVYTPKQLCSDA